MIFEKEKSFLIVGDSNGTSSQKNNKKIYEEMDFLCKRSRISSSKRT